MRASGGRNEEIKSSRPSKGISGWESGEILRSNQRTYTQHENPTAACIPSMLSIAGLWLLFGFDHPDVGRFAVESRQAAPESVR